MVVTLKGGSENAQAGTLGCPFMKFERGSNICEILTIIRFNKVLEPSSVLVKDCTKALRKINPSLNLIETLSFVRKAFPKGVFEFWGKGEALFNVLNGADLQPFMNFSETFEIQDNPCAQALQEIEAENQEYDEAIAIVRSKLDAEGLKAFERILELAPKMFMPHAY